MSRFYWCKDRMDWVESPPANLRSVHIISDECEFISQADGKGYSSKSKYRRSLRDHGMIEMGNERVQPKSFQGQVSPDDLRRVAWEKGVQF